MIIFDDEELEYLKWVEANPTAFVVNTTRGKGYAMVHTAQCATIRRRPGSDEPTHFTDHEYIKACSLDRQKCIDWAAKKSPEDHTFCQVCEP